MTHYCAHMLHEVHLYGSSGGTLSYSLIPITTHAIDCAGHKLVSVVYVETLDHGIICQLFVMITAAVCSCCRMQVLCGVGVESDTYFCLSSLVSCVLENCVWCSSNWGYWSLG